MNKKKKRVETKLTDNKKLETAVGMLVFSKTQEVYESMQNYPGADENWKHYRDMYDAWVDELHQVVCDIAHDEAKRLVFVKER